jgi:hypothetical protein
MLRRDEAAHGNRAQVRDQQVGSLLQPLGRFGCNGKADARRTVDYPDENCLARVGDLLHRAERNERIAAFALREHDRLAANQYRACVRMLQGAGYKRLIASSFAHTIKRRACVGEIGPGAKRGGQWRR